MSTRANIIREGFKPGTERKQFIDLLRSQGNRISYSEMVVLDLHEENEELLAALKEFTLRFEALEEKEAKGIKLYWREITAAGAYDSAKRAIARADQKGETKA